MKNLICIAIVSFLALTSSSAGQIEVYIKFDGGGSGIEIAEGNSSDTTYEGSKGWFRLDLFRFGMKNTSQLLPSYSVGLPTFDEVTITKEAGAGSAQLFTACASGQIYDTVTIVIAEKFFPNGSSGLPTLVRRFQLEMYTVLVGSIKAAGIDGAEVLNEDVTLRHGAQRLQFFTIGENFDEVPAGEATWNVLTDSDRL